MKTDPTKFLSEDEVTQLVETRKMLQLAMERIAWMRSYECGKVHEACDHAYDAIFNVLNLSAHYLDVEPAIKALGG